MSAQVVGKVYCKCPVGHTTLEQWNSCPTRYVQEAPDKFENPKLRHKVPCNECPWRRTHSAGYLGGYEPEQFTSQVHHDGAPLSCHKTDQLEQPSMCAGALIHMKNSIKAPRHPAYGNALEKVKPDTEKIFEWPHQFVEHHRKLNGWLRAATKRNKKNGERS